MTDRTQDALLAPATPTTADVFDRIGRIAHAGLDQTVTLRDILRELDHESFVVVVLILHFLNGIPIPNPLFCVMIGVSAALIAGQAVLGRTFLWLPGVLLRRTINRDALKQGLLKSQPLIGFLRRWTRPRLANFTTRRAARLLMCLVVVLSLVIATILPIGNFMISIGIVVMCLGLLIGDGAFVLVGTAVALFGVAWATMVMGGLVLVAFVAIKSAIVGHIVLW